MKWKIEFTGDEEELEEMELISSYRRIKDCLEKIKEILRRKVKYEEMSEEKMEVIEWFRELLYDCE